MEHPHCCMHVRPRERAKPREVSQDGAETSFMEADLAWNSLPAADPRRDAQVRSSCGISSFARPDSMRHRFQFSTGSSFADRSTPGVVGEPRLCRLSEVAMSTRPPRSNQSLPPKNALSSRRVV